MLTKLVTAEKCVPVYIVADYRTKTVSFYFSITSVDGHPIFMRHAEIRRRLTLILIISEDRIRV